MSNPPDRQSTPSLREFVERKLDARLEGLRVALPARVTAYDPARQCVDAQPLVYQAYADEGAVRRPERLPIVTDIPVVFPGSGPFRITFPVVAGDIVLLVFASSSIARWKVTGREGDPGDDRHHRLSDAIAIPGLASLASQPTEAPTDALVVHGDEVRLGGPDATEEVAWHSALVALKDVFDAWVVAPTDGGGALKTLLTTLISGGWPQGATKVKAE